MTAPDLSEYARLRVGNLVTPLDAATTNSLLQDADPALYGMLAYYQAVLQIHLGARFDAEVSRVGLPPSLLGQVSTTAIPFDPGPFLQKAQITPPILALFRGNEEVNESNALNWFHIESHWQLQYILPPMTTAQYAQMYPLLRAVVVVLSDRTEQGFDPAYLAGEYVVRTCGLEEIGIRKIRYGAIEGPLGKSEMFFPALQMEIFAPEQKHEVPGLTRITGADNTMTVDGVDAVADTEVTIT